MPNYYLMHVGVGPDDNPPGPGSGRYRKGSGARPYQHDEAMRRQMRIEKVKAVGKKVAAGIGKAAWTGVTVALKVVANTVITSTTIGAIGAAGFQFIQSPAAQELMGKISVAAGNLFYSNFIEPAAKEAVKNFDTALGTAVNAVGAIDPGTPNLGSLTEGTQYIEKLMNDPTAQYIAKSALKALT